MKLWILIIFFTQNVFGVCNYGQFGSSCELNSTQCAASRCNSNGACTAQTEGCSCDPGFYLENCLYTAQTCGQTYCNNLGICIPNGNSAAPDCLCNYFAMTGQCDTCDEGFDYTTNCTSCVEHAFGPLCNWNQTTCDSLECNNHGTCIYGTSQCQCQNAWNATSKCNQTLCDTTISHPSSNGSYCECVWPYQLVPYTNGLSCAILCNYPMGTYSYSQNRCVCRDGYSGLSCADNDGSNPHSWQFALLIICSSIFGLLALIGLCAYCFCGNRTIRVKDR